jgi:penicillin G amidase
MVTVLAAAALSGLAIGTVRRSFPDLEGTIQLPGLSHPVEVLRDSHGVPQIYADNAEDLFEAQGYLTAQDRFWEMDVRRHVASGRLSELFGDSQVVADTYLRTLGLHRVAQQEMPLLSSSTRRYLDAYAAGVNAYLRGRSAAELSLEYLILDVRGVEYVPEPWTAVDSVAWLKAMAWDLGENLEQERDQALLTAKVGAVRAAQLYPDYPLAGFSPILTRGRVDGETFDPKAPAGNARISPALTSSQQESMTGALESVDRLLEAVRPWLAPVEARGELGSNAWVVSGRHTTTGRPLLGNDPHLATAIPSVFTQVGLHCRVLGAHCPFDVAGYSLAGVPGVVVGHNRSIAWGLSTSYVDQQDLYLEQLEGDSVRRGNRYEPLSIRTEQVVVAGDSQPRTIRIRSSRHGPILSGIDQRLREVGVGAAARDDEFAYGVALSWVALTPSRTMDGILGLNSASDFTAFRAAAALVSAPSQNLVYADTSGHIGYQLAGSVPRRLRGNGRVPAPGWNEAFDWQGTVPAEALPYDLDPPSGIIVAANQPIIGRQYPYQLGSSYSYGWRSQQLLERLTDGPPLDVSAAEQLFYDDTIRFAEDLVPVLLRIKVSDPWIAEGQNTLVGWDYSSGTDSAAAAYFAVVFHDLLKRTFRDELPESLWPSGGDRWYAVMTHLLQNRDDPWWDDVTTDEVRERRDDILLAAMNDARRELTSLMARDSDEWQWGKLHRVTLRHATLGRDTAPGLVRRAFNRGSFPVSGGPAVVNAMGFDLRQGYRVSTGPAMRMLVDLDDLDRSRWVNQSGVSGHAYHTYYDDQLRLWAANQTWPFVFSRGAVDGAVRHRLELVPSG